ncbi:hypothetical protein HR057_02820 [Bacillus sp. P2(2020)]|uniref:Uncharacterized protein n=1 Tax=Calidifontibacillus erzurumensis TaxID=2741433 RepID=A0A8J8KAD8_9BACI|nr:hypothetical protein [Calidifontibacillus erzurumensis]
MAREAKAEFEKGTDLKTIRTLIDKKYGNNGVESTPTPMPE